VSAEETILEQATTAQAVEAAFPSRHELQLELEISYNI